MTDSCSLTPPLSPSAQIVDISHQKLQDLGEWVSPCFTCGGIGTALSFTSSSKNYLRSGELQKLLEDELISDCTSSSVLLYDMTLSSKTGIFTNLKQLFACTRKQYYLLKTSPQGNISGFSPYANRDVSAIRKDMVNFLLHLKVSLQRLFLITSEQQHYSSAFYDPVLNLKSVLTEVLRELKNLLLFARRISDLPDHTFTNVSGNSNNSLCYHLVHFCLDLWWSSLEIMHIVQCICSSQNIELNEEICSYTFQGSRSAFSQTALLILWDLCFISLKNYKNYCVGSLGLSPFLCSCVQELWIMLIILLDKRHENFKEGSFWEHLDFIVRSVISRNLQSSSPVQSMHSFSLQRSQLVCDKPEEFCLWIINHVSPLYKFSVDGVQVEFKDVRSCYNIVRYLVESVLSLQMKAKQEKHLRTALSFCGPLLKLWEPSGEILLPLTDFFLRHIDDSFCLPGFEIRELSYLFKTGTAWVEHVRKVISLENYFSSGENSFYLYLHILGIQLKKSGAGGSLWRQLKGRIYSRFMARRLKELGEVGLQNCFSILLVIACVGFLEVSAKINELIAIIETPPTSKKKQAISWKTSFSLMIFLEEKNSSVENDASKLVSFFNKACSAYNEVSADSIKKIDLLNLILVYLENVVDIFERSTYLGLSEYLLVGTGFTSLLPACGVSELNSILEIVLNLLVRFRHVKEYCQTHQIILYQLQHAMLWESFCLNVLPFVMNSVTLRSPPSQLADIAVAFTVLSLYFHENSLKSGRSCFELFRHFGAHKNASSSLMCRYLCFILLDSMLMKEIKMHIPDLHVMVFQSWLKCGISLSPPCIQMKELTRVVLSLEEVVLVFPDIKSVVSSEDHGFTMIKLFRAIDESHQRCSTLQEKNNLRQKVHTYFQALPTCVTLIIKGDTTNSLLHHVYKIIGHLFQYCSPYLYIKYKSDCIFPQLLDTLILPHIMFPKEKGMINSLSTPIKEHLSLFIRGLARLDLKNDSYVKRKFREIMTYYISHHTFASAPLLEIALDASCHKSESMSKDLFYFLVEVLRENFLAKNTPGSSLGVKFCMEIFKRVSSDVRFELSSNLLSCVFEQLLLRDDPGIPILKELLKLMLSVFQKESDLNRSILIRVVKNLIEKHLPWSTSRVFRWLQYTTETLPFLMSEIIPFLTKTVEAVEKKRGVGSDLALRNGLKNLVNRYHQCK